MGRKSKVKKAPKKFSAPKLKEVSGPWSVSYNYIDRSGPFAWPSEEEPLFQELATFMARLSMFEFDECTSITRVTGKSAHGPITGELTVEAEEELNALKRNDPEMERLSFDGEITRFTYCYSRNQPRRIYGIRLGSVVYLLWWDPTHGVTGSANNSTITPCASSGKCHHV